MLLGNNTVVSIGTIDAERQYAQSVLFSQKINMICTLDHISMLFCAI